MPMNREDFDEEIRKVAIAYDRKPKHELGDMIYGRVQHFTIEDFRVAIEELLNDGERRTFPRVGEIRAAVESAYLARHDQDWKQTKARERRDIDRIMGSEEGDTIRKRNLLKLKLLMQMIGHGKDAVDQLARDFEEEQTEEKVWCRCDDGLVYYTEQQGFKDNQPLMYRYVAACSICEAGRQRPKCYASMDPGTLQVVRPLVALETGG